MTLSNPRTPILGSISFNFWVSYQLQPCRLTPLVGQACRGEEGDSDKKAWLMNGREGEESGRALGAQLDEGCMEEKGGTWSKIPKYKSWHFHLLAVTSNTLFNLCKSLLSRMSRRCINIVHMCREIIIYAKQIHVFFVQKNYSSGPLSISEPNGGLLPAKSGILGIYCCIKKKISQNLVT